MNGKNETKSKKKKAKLLLLVSLDDTDDRDHERDNLKDVEQHECSWFIAKGDES